MRTILLLLNLVLLTSCSMTLPKADNIDGVSVVASRSAISEKHIQAVVNINANYASLMPFGFIRELVPS